MKLHALKMMMLVDLETRDDDFLMITGKRRMMASEVGSEERSGKQMRKFELMSGEFEPFLQGKRRGGGANRKEGHLLLAASSHHHNHQNLSVFAYF